MNLSKKIFSPIAVFLFLISQVAFPIPALAAGTVGTGSPASCTEGALDTVLTGGGLVDFNCGGAPLTITLTTTKTIASDTQIDGGGLITLSGNNSIRLFVVNAGISLSITGLTLTQGKVVDDVGGAILANSNSTVNITNSTFSSNAASSNNSTAPGSGHGGAIYAGSGSHLNITNSGFSTNSAVGDTGAPPSSGNGGAIYAGSGSTVNIDTSTFSANSTNHGYGGAIYVNGLTTLVSITDTTFVNNSTQVNTFDLSLGGGAIQNNDGTVHISDSTFQDNHVDGNGPDGGAIFNGDFEGDGGDIMTITNSTFENNFFTGLGGSSAGGAIRSNGAITITYSTFSNNANGVSTTPLDDGGAGAVTIAGGTGKLVNSIFANTKSGNLDCVVRTANATLDPSSGGNLIENQFGCGTAVSSDPVLGSLQDNGGPTQTMALGDFSPALDAATCLGSPQVDQRNISRPQGEGCDIGAFERDTTAPTVTINQAVGQADPTNTSPINFTIVFSEPIANFISGDVTISGTAGPTTAVVTEIAPNDGTTYNVAVSGMSMSGTVLTTVAAGVAQDVSANGNLASTSTDNTVIYDLVYPTVSSSTPSNSATLTSGLTQLTVQFSKDVKSDGSATAANNKLNYLLVKYGANNTFDTTSCQGGLAADDAQITINSATYSNGGGAGPFVATLNVNSGTTLPTGHYRLFVCGTTTIEDQAGNALNNGTSDSIVTFNVMSQTFQDVFTTYWAWRSIEALYAAGVTGGCNSTPSPLLYCPGRAVSRDQMAVFLLKGMHGSGYTPPAVGATTGFNDVAINYWAAAWIKELAAEGITGGCTAGYYCPSTAVTRDQMAVFLLKAKYGPSFRPAAAVGIFSDVPASYWAASWIEKLANDGITSGCSGGKYCPSAGVTRDQMAVFLIKTFNIPLP